jgi:hypothetical protein
MAAAPPCCAWSEKTTVAAKDVTSLRELRRKPYPSLAPLAKMQTVISIHDPRVLNVSAADLIDGKLVRKFDEDGELDALYATHSVG